MRVLDRRPSALIKGPFEARHRRALVGLVTIVTPGISAAVRYLSQRGRYPWTVAVATPLGSRSVTLHSRHDLLTVNEVFCRRDYGESAPGLVVDVGANMGLASLFWLTRRPDSRIYCYEPDPRNVSRLRETLTGFEERFHVSQAAVGLEVGRARFASEPSGRYGHLDAAGDLETEVVSLNSELARIEAAEGQPIDLLKIDTEGTEHQLVEGLSTNSTVREVVWEDENGHVRRLVRSSSA